VSTLARPSPDPVLQVHKFMFDRGGLERYLFFLQGELERRGHRVVTFGMRHPAARPSPYTGHYVSPVEFAERPGLGQLPGAVRALGRAIFSLEALRRARDLVRATRPAVAHVHEIHHHLSPSVLVALREAGVPVVLSAHEYKLVCPTVWLHDGTGICEACRPHRYWEPLRRRCSNGSLARSAGAALEASLHHLAGLYDRRHVQVIAAGSRFVYDKLREFGIEEDRLALLPYVLDPAEWGEAETEAGEYLAFTGRCVAGKGVRTLVQALSLAGDPPAVIAGDGPEWERLGALAARLGLTRLRMERVPASPDSHRRLRQVLRGARAAVMPSEVYETFGYAAYEAMAVGRPVVASRLGPLPELVVEGETGLLFRPGDAEDLARCLRRLLDDAALARRLGAAARRAVEARTDLDGHYERVRALYLRAGAAA